MQLFVKDARKSVGNMRQTIANAVPNLAEKAPKPAVKRWRKDTEKLQGAFPENEKYFLGIAFSCYYKEIRGALFR